MNLRTILRRGLVGVAATTAVMTLAAPAFAVPQEPVKTNPNIDEFTPAATAGHLAWSQNTATSEVFTAYIQPDGGARTRINAPSTNAFVGGFSEDGATLAFQQVTNNGAGNSNIRMWDVASGTSSNPPSGVNTTAWEWSPSVSNTHLLFGRIRRAPNPDVWEIFLKDLESGTLTKVASVTGNNVYLKPGQVVGDHVVYYRYTTASPGHVWRYQISTQQSIRLPRSDAYNYGPSVTPDGDVYFAPSGDSCGNSVEIMRWDGPGTTPVEIVNFANGRDLFQTYTYVDELGDRHVYYDRGGCADSSNMDIYRATDPAPGGGPGTGAAEVDGAGVRASRAWPSDGS